MGNARNIAFWVIMFVLVLTMFQFFGGTTTSGQSDSLSYSQFVDMVDKGQVQTATLNGEQVTWKSTDGKSYSTVAPADSTLTQRLIAKGVEVTAKPQTPSMFSSLISLWLPFLLLIGVWFFFMNRMQGGGKGGAMGFGKSRAKLLTE